LRSNFYYVFELYFSLESEKEEDAVAAYWVTDGIERCRVGFLPRYLLGKKKAFHGILVQVTELLSDSDNATDRERSRKNRGVVRVAVLTDRNALFRDGD